MRTKTRTRPKGNTYPGVSPPEVMTETAVKMGPQYPAIQWRISCLLDLGQLGESVRLESASLEEERIVEDIRLRETSWAWLSVLSMPIRT